MSHRWNLSLSLALLSLAAGALAGCELDDETLNGGGAGTGDGMFYLRVSDTGAAACTSDEPGADVDAVGLEVDGTLIYAGWARYDPPVTGGCANAHGVATAAMGAPELLPTSGFVSLNGGALVLAFLDAQGAAYDLLPNDRVRFFESGAAIGERVTLEVGPGPDGPWTHAAGDVADGEAFLSFTQPSAAASALTATP